jgi:hypothetical protein
MAGQVLRVVLEPPEDHPNHGLVSGERIEALVVIDDFFPWHKPWEKWTIAEVTSDVVIEED